MRRFFRGTVRRLSVQRLTSVEEVSLIPAERMVTFSVIAHVDHGKSSLSQRLLEQQGNIARQDGQSQDALDTLKVEQARGITVKAVTASMVYDASESESWLFNLVDCPGHSDFAHEVRRSLSCCDGALLLVDASQGIEAQTLSVAAAAKAAGVPLIAACSKCDLPTSRADDVALHLAELGLIDDPEDVLQVSAKSGLNVDKVLPHVAKFVKTKTTTSDRRNRPLRARVVDSKYDEKRGVICVIQVVDGTLKEQQRIAFFSRVVVKKDDSCSSESPTKKVTAAATYNVQEVGLLTPKQQRVQGGIVAGCVGYVVCGLRNIREAAVGDTVYDANDFDGVEPLESNFRPSRPALYASVFPPDGALFDDMAKAIDRLALNDASVTVQREPPRPTLGLGLRVGFLGLLHLSVFSQRLVDEFQHEVLFCAPNVPYRFKKKTASSKEDIDDEIVTTSEADFDLEIETLDDWPTDQLASRQMYVFEPVVDVDVVLPSDYLGSALKVLEERITIKSIDSSIEATSIIKCVAPWAAVVEGLGETLAEATRGYASLNVVDDEPKWRRNDNLQKVDIAINNEVVHALSFISERDDAQKKGRVAAEKLKTLVPRQLFEVAIQARVGLKSIAKERIAPFRKDVLTKGGKTVGGGDPSRKRKLLEKQKAGKKRSKTVGNVELDQSCLWSVLGMPTDNTKVKKTTR